MLQCQKNKLIFFGWKETEKERVFKEVLEIYVNIILNKSFYIKLV